MREFIPAGNESKSCLHDYIFSKGGFTPALLEAEKQGAVKLLTLEDRYR